MSRLTNQNQVVSASSRRLQPALTVQDAIALIVGIVIGAGIFETPALVAANTANPTLMILTWVIGGGVSVIGALCYAELATAYPHVGGNYYYLKRAFGLPMAFLFSWARMTVIQTGSIALLAFVFGDYASQWLRLGDFSASIYAALAIALLTGLNLRGLQQGTQTQNWLTSLKILGLLLVILVGLSWSLSGVSSPVTVTTAPSQTRFGLALVFVLLSYGGWNEAAYISAEIQNHRRNLVRSLLWSIGLITAIYILINLAYLWGLGQANMAQSEAVAADLMRWAFGEPGAIFISLLVALSALGALNATIFTGARTNYAFGQDISLFRFLGHWQPGSSVPRAAFGLQGAIALALIGLGSLTRNGFETMVDYTAPVFWFFFLLSGISLFILRQQNPDYPHPFRVPFYPLVPLLFCAICGYLLYSSLVYTGIGAMVGVAVVASGLPFWYWHHQHSS